MTAATIERMSGEATVALRRLQGIDICRSFAILLAMLNHAAVEFDLARFWGAEITPVRFFMQMATPTFICLFGAMLELTYGRKMQAGQVSAVTSRLLVRSLQCYALYALAVGARVAVGDYSIGFALRCMLLIGSTPYTDILKFYCLILAMAPLLIALRLRFGLVAVVVAGIAIHLFYPVLTMIPSPPQIGGKDYIGMGTRFLIGVGDSVVGGPSLLHGLAMVLFGILIGNALGKIRQADITVRCNGWLVLVVMAAFFATVSAALWDWTNTGTMIREVISYELRNENHPMYTALGLTTTTVAVIASTYLFDLKKIRSLDWIKYIGTVSLFTFAFGNILLIIQPWHSDSIGTSTALVLIFGGLVALQSYFFYSMMKVDQTGASGRSAIPAAIVQGITRSSSAFLGRLAAVVVPSYSRLVKSVARLSLAPAV